MKTAGLVKHSTAMDWWKGTSQDSEYPNIQCDSAPECCKCCNANCSCTNCTQSVFASLQCPADRTTWPTTTCSTPTTTGSTSPATTSPASSCAPIYAIMAIAMGAVGVLMFQ